MNQVPLQRTSYGPYARAMVRICKGKFSSASGYDIDENGAGSDAQKRMAQDALTDIGTRR